MSKNTNISELINYISVNGSGDIVMTGNLIMPGGAQAATQTYVSTAISNLVASSPATLDTLNELATALGNDPNFATTVATSIGTKQPQLNGTGFVKVTGTTVSYDNSTYLTTSTAGTTYVPYTGATSDVILGANKIKANSVYAEGSGGAGGALQIKQYTSASINEIGYSSIGTLTNGYFYFASAAAAPDFKTFAFNPSGITLNTLRTYTLPDASGTLALTSNIPSVSGVYLPLAGGTLSGSTSEMLGISTSSTSGTILRLSNTSVGGGDFRWYSSGLANGEGAGKLLLTFNSATPVMTITGSNGFTGINETNPRSVLQTTSTGLGDTGGLTIKNSGSGGGSWFIWPTATINGEGAGKLIFSSNTVANVLTLTSGAVGIRTVNPSNTTFAVTATGLSQAVSAVSIAVSGSGTFQRGVLLLNSGLVAGESLLYMVGKEQGIKNAGQLYFHYAGAASDSNRLSLGIYAVDDILNAFASGNIVIGSVSDNGSKFQVSGAATISSSITALESIYSTNKTSGFSAFSVFQNGNKLTIAGGSGGIQFNNTANSSGLVSIFNNGNVLIGTTGTDGGFKLDVSGTARFTSTIDMVGGTCSAQYVFGAGGIGMSRTQANNSIWWNAGADMNHVLWNDYYGGPTTRPLAATGFDGIKWNTYRGLYIYGGAAGAITCLAITNSNGATNDHTVALFASGTQRFITSTTGATVTGLLYVLNQGAGINDGNVQIQTSTGGSGTGCYFGANNNGSYGFLMGYSNGLDGWTASILRTMNTNPLYFITNQTNIRMTLTNAGYLGINDSSPVAQLVVRGGGVADGTTTFGVILDRGTKIAWTNGGQGTTGEYIYSQTNAPYGVTIHSGGYNALSCPNTGNVYINYEAGNLGVGTDGPSYKLHVNGTAYATGAAGSLSDIRHKNNVVSTLKGLNEILQLNPVEFEWNKDKIIDKGMEGTHLGFIAQEVANILPNTILVEPNEEETLGLKYGEFIPVLVKAIQELKAENDLLKDRLDKNNIN